MKIEILKNWILILAFFPSLLAAQSVVINEVMSSNQSTLFDEDGEVPDWIELFNNSDQRINLEGYFLSDDSSDLKKWQFGNFEIGSKEHIIVFASDKNVSQLLKYWHTIITEGDSWKYKIGDQTIPNNWIESNFDDTHWVDGPSGFGYSDGDDNTDLSLHKPITSIFVRKQFNIAELNSVHSAVLHIDYDDGFVAYINGNEVARANLNPSLNQPAWNEFASESEAKIYNNGFPDEFKIINHGKILVEGENVIAIQLHNTSLTSSDLSLIPFLSLGLNNNPVNLEPPPEILRLDVIDSYLHTNFKISSAGEKILLSDPEGNIVDQIDIPNLPPDISYARKNDAGMEWILQTPSPGEINYGDQILGIADSITVSNNSGFYFSPFSLSLSAGESTIYYTLDGSDPDSSSDVYSSPIYLSKTTVLKAVAKKQDFISSELITKTYFINENTNLPVISLSTDPYNLFDYNYGIYVDGPGWTPSDPHYGANYWMDWERPAHIEFFEDDKNFGFEENCAIAIFGGWTRSSPQKSLSVKFKSEYDATRIKYKLFEDLDVNSFKSFILRNSGNDFYYTHIRDAVMQRLVKNLDIDYLEYRPAVTFINGEYWGIYNIREKISEHYIAERHNVDPDNIDMLQMDMEVIHGDNLHYKNIVDYISTEDMSTEASYNFINNNLDLDECLLYFAAQIYFNNKDWPGNNIKYWRERSEKGKWRWILYDTDFGFNLYQNNGQAEDHLSFTLDPNGISYANASWATLLPRKLIENPIIKNKFINLFADLLNTNFEPSRVISIISQTNYHISNEISRHRNRFNISGENLEKMQRFALERPDYLRGYIRNYFNAGNDISVTVSSTNGGKIKLNSIMLEEDKLPWSGKYFKNNEIHLKAIPNTGYKFDGWSGTATSNESSISISGENVVNISAVFLPTDTDVKEIVINEINYNSSDLLNSGDWIELLNRSNETIDLSGWKLKDDNENNEFEIPFGTKINSGEYIVIVEDKVLFSNQFPEVENSVGALDFGFSGSGELIRLYDSDKQLIDSLTFDDEFPWPEEAAGQGSSLELVDADENNSLPENWKSSIGPGTPGKINSVVTGIENALTENINHQYKLFQNYPNPFNNNTIIKYYIPQQSSKKEGFSKLVSIKVFDILGQEIAMLINQKQKPGVYEIQFNSETLPSGIYLYQIKIGSFSETKKAILLK